MTALRSFVRARWIVLVVVAVVAIAGTVVVLVAIGGDDEPAARSGIDPREVLDDRQRELVQNAEPSPDCDRPQPTAPADRSLQALDILRVEGTCLTTTTEYLPADRIAARQAELAADPTVVVAAVVPLPSIEQLDDHRDDQWPLDVLGVPADSTDLPWPDGRGTVVAVIDSGVDAGHPDLAGAVIARRDFAGQGAPDEDGHGTHVAGIVAARNGNGGITGVAPGTSVLDVPVRLEGINPGGPSWIVGLVWAVNHGADVANLSLGGAVKDYLPETLEAGAAAVEFARDNGVVVVAAAGNCGNRCDERNRRQVPAAYSPVLAVGAVQKDLDLAGYSTRNEDVDLVAPGGGDAIRLVWSTYPGGKFEPLSGTSQAAPHVAAAAAIAKAASPRATADEIAQAVLDSADRGRVSKGDRSRIGVGRGLLDIPGLLDEVRTDRPPAQSADRSQVAYVQDGTLFVFDGDTSRPVRGATGQLRRVEWSADHTFLVGADERMLFSWAGPGMKPVEKTCDWCADPNSAPVFVENAAVTDPVEAEPSGDLILRITPDGTLTRYNAHTLDEIGAAQPRFPVDSVGSKSLHGAVGGRLIVHESGGAHASERLWLVDPVSGAVSGSHDVAGSVLRGVAVNADRDRFAAVTGYSDCGQAEGVYVLDDELGGPATPAPPPGDMIDELFWSGDTLYAAMSGYDVIPGEGCKRIAQAGLWRLEGFTWNQVDPYVATARPVEGRPTESETGWLVVRDGQGSLEPAAVDDPAEGDLGAVGRPLWSTPTRTEVGRGDPPPPPATPVSPPPAPPSNQGDPVDPADYRGPYGDAYYFASPSGNFHCGISASEPNSTDAGCEGPTQPIPPKPASCQLSWGNGIAIGNAGQVSFSCIGGLTYPEDGKVLPYGRSLSVHGYTCTSAETGMRCVHDASGHGFRIASRSNELF